MFIPSIRFPRLLGLLPDMGLGGGDVQHHLRKCAGIRAGLWQSPFEQVLRGAQQQRVLEIRQLQHPRRLKLSALEKVVQESVHRHWHRHHRVPSDTRVRARGQQKRGVDAPAQLDQSQPYDRNARVVQGRTELKTFLYTWQLFLPADTKCATYHVTLLLCKLQYWHLARLLRLRNSAVKMMMEEHWLLYQYLPANTKCAIYQVTLLLFKLQSRDLTRL